MCDCLIGRCLFDCLFVCWFAFVFVCLFICMIACLLACLFVCLIVCLCDCFGERGYFFVSVLGCLCLLFCVVVYVTSVRLHACCISNAMHCSM